MNGGRRNTASGALASRERVPPRVSPGGRDLRLDFFRGLALLWVYLIHTRSDLLLWFTQCNYGFSDPAEVFIFISGYVAGLSYGQGFHRFGWAPATRRIIRQCARIYSGHLVLVGLLVFEVAVAGGLAAEMQIDQVFAHPGLAVLSALRLQFRPANVDVLPLFVLLFLSLPIALPALDRWPIETLAGSAGLYLYVQFRHLNLPGYLPGQEWFFNPFAWQFLFYLGVFFGRRQENPRPLLPRHPVLTGLAVLILALSALVTLGWQFPVLKSLTPHRFDPLLYPISKTDLAPVRLVHFCALAYLIAVWSDRRPFFAEGPLAREIILCGQHSLWIFGTGVLLSYIAELFLTQHPGGILLPLLVGAAGILCLFALARVPDWIRSIRSRTRDERQSSIHSAAAD